MVSRDTAVERSITVFLNDVDRYSVSCNFCPVLTGAVSQPAARWQPTPLPDTINLTGT